MEIELVTDPDACMMYIVSPLAGLGGAYRGGLPATAGYYSVKLVTPPSIAVRGTARFCQ